MIFDQQLNELWESNQLINNQLIRYSPSHHLSSIVEQYFVVDNIQSNTAPVFILPDLSGHLILYQFKGNGDYKYHFSLVGSRTSGFCISRRKRIRTFIIRFHPGVFSKLTRVLGQESCDQSFPMKLFFPVIAEQLAVFFPKQIDRVKDFKSIFQWLETHLLEPLQIDLQLPKRMLGFLAHLKSKDISLNVKTAAKKMGISERYLHKIATRHLGINPNKAIRIGRLAHSFEQRMHNPQYNWSDIACLSGYADQSHMIEEYQEMLDRTPRQLVASLVYQ